MVSAASIDAYHAARQRAAVLDRSSRGRLVLSGRDRRSYLQGLLTNDITALGPGEGCYAAYLTPQGRMIADLFVYELADAILVSTIGDVKDLLAARLDELIFSEDVQVTDVTTTFAQVAVVGPDAAAIVAPIASIARSVLEAMPEHACRRTVVADAPGIVTRIVDVGEPGFDLYVSSAGGASLLAAIREAGASPLDQAAADALRIEAGVPMFGQDMDQDTIPLEAGIEDRAISFTKGCYVGQEVIVRVLQRGHGRIARKLVGVRLEANEPPARGAPIRHEGRDVGRVTSGAWSPALGAAIALGYVPRDLAAPGSPHDRRQRRRLRHRPADWRRRLISCSVGRRERVLVQIGTRRPGKLLTEAARGLAAKVAPEEMQLDAPVFVVVHDAEHLGSHVGVHVELLPQLAPQAGFERFARLTLSAGELPASRQMHARLPSRDEQAPVVARQGRPRRRRSSSARASLARRGDRQRVGPAVGAHRAVRTGRIARGAHRGPEIHQRLVEIEHAAHRHERVGDGPQMAPRRMALGVALGRGRRERGRAPHWCRESRRARETRSFEWPRPCTRQCL